MLPSHGGRPNPGAAERSRYVSDGNCCGRWGYKKLAPDAKSDSGCYSGKPHFLSEPLSLYSGFDTVIILYTHNIFLSLGPLLLFFWAAWTYMDWSVIANRHFPNDFPLRRLRILRIMQFGLTIKDGAIVYAFTDALIFRLRWGISES